MPEIETLHIRVRGLVQGVGYRYFVQETGSSLRLTGWVRNIPGGDVEIEARGNAAALERFIDAIRNDHPYARVNDIQVERVPGDAAGQAEKSFIILF